MSASISLDHVSKKFSLHLERPRSFQELFLGLVRPSTGGRIAGPARRSREELWALQDVSLKIGKGEMVGIVGENGAGKSTLLKLLSRIVEPTSGHVRVNGRVSALLELGTGFHPDLTGRENLYLNGSILGFSRRDMNRLYDGIVDFSELGRFIDMPVKHYSSGMYMRLAFSIAIHVRPEILLVDEILAVGDHAFQLRCLDRINALKRNGVTIVFVSHDLSRVRQLCDWAVWLQEGVMAAQGNTEYVLEQYLGQSLADDSRSLHREEATKSRQTPQRWGSGEAQVTAVQILDGQGCEQRAFRTGDALLVRIHYRAQEPIAQPRFGVAIYHGSGFQVNGPNNVFSGYPIPELSGEGYVEYAVESLPLLPGTYLLSAAIYDHEGGHAYDHWHQGFTFRVVPGGSHEEFGSFYVPCVWRWRPSGPDPSAACAEGAASAAGGAGDATGPSEQGQTP